jgi:Rrf2 family iron-sulfur cluster assembly transcriptional regulator
MNISPVEEYSLRCLLQLARNEEGPMTIRQISRKEGLSTAYVAKLLHHLQKNGLVQALRGVQGGYTLARQADEISLSEIFRASSDRHLEEVCGRYTGSQQECVHSGHCEIKSVWDQLSRHIYGFLDRIHLSDLAQRRAPMPPAGGAAFQADLSQ